MQLVTGKVWCMLSIISTLSGCGLNLGCGCNCGEIEEVILKICSRLYINPMPEPFENSGYPFFQHCQGTV